MSAFPGPRLTWQISELVSGHAADPGLLLDHAAELIGTAVGGSCVVGVLFDDGAKIHPLGVFHVNDRRMAALQSSAELTWSPVTGPVLELIHSGAPSRLDAGDVREAARFSPWAATFLDADEDARGLAVVMRALGRPVGVVAAIRAASLGAFTNDEVQAIQLVADNLGLAARLVELEEAVESSTHASPVPLDDGRLASLSTREREILQAIERGLSSREVGLELHLSARTIEWHRARLIAKLGTSSRSELIAVARALGGREGQ